MANAPFPIDPYLTGIAQVYRNPDVAYIADEVLPFGEPMDKEEFSYNRWKKEEAYTVPDTRVGRKSAPRQVEFNAERIQDVTEDHGLDDPIPIADIANATGSVDPVGRAVQGLTDLIQLGRELRVSTLVTNPANYPTANKITITNKWSDFANSDPIKDIQAGLDACILRPNRMAIGRLVMSQLQMHPKINKAVHGTAGDSGIAPVDAIARIFGLQGIDVGEAFVNNAKKGQAASYQRAWGKSVVLYHRNRAGMVPDATAVTFGWTARFLERIAGSYPDPKIGIRGGIVARVGESVKEVLSAPDVAYLIQDAIA